MTPKLLYRMRSINSLIGEHKELENQEIYFAGFEALNDPAEGIKDIFWSGDAILWQNLLKHYLLCLMRVLLCAHLGAERKSINWNYLALIIDEDLPHEQRIAFREAYDEFFRHRLVLDCKQWLVRRRCIRRNELIYCLHWIHSVAVDTVKRAIERHGAIPIIPTYDPPPSLSISDTDDPKSIESVCAGQNHIRLQRNLMAQGKRSIPWKEMHNLIILDFPEEYIRVLELAVHPECYVACFLESYDNPSVWGHYGDSHKGVCLIFRTQESGQLGYLRLHGISGLSFGPQGSSPSYSDVNHRLVKVTYSTKYLEVDFFQSLGRMPRARSEKFWYQDDNGTRSPALNDLIFDESWRHKYWEDYLKGTAIKSADWEYEKEHRLILNNSVIDYSDKATRKWKYYLSDLEGIIFGIKTSQEHKVQIMKTIDDKCRKESRRDFKFYQAMYSTVTGKIEAVELNLLKFDGGQDSPAGAV